MAPSRLFLGHLDPEHFRLVLDESTRVGLGLLGAALTQGHFGFQTRVFCFERGQTGLDGALELTVVRLRVLGAGLR